MRQAYLRQPGCLVQANSGRLLLGITITLIVLSVYIKSSKFDLELNNWIQTSSRIQNELNYIDNLIGDGIGSNVELIIQTPISAATGNGNNVNNNNKNVLNVDALMIHLEAMFIATHITVDLYDVTWSLKDLCYRPTLPNLEGFELSNLLDKMMPCNIKTPLDCFWEGAKLHHQLDSESMGGSSSSVGLSTSSINNEDQEQHLPFGLKKWTQFDPIKIIKLLNLNHRHSSFNYDLLLNWMQRVGIRHGYQRKPCLDPTDLECPETAPNKFTKLPPNIGKELTGGCYGIAENQMHWHEEEIVGGILKNKTGFIIKANALQSSIPLMYERDMFEYWRKTEQTQDISNWSIEKAKIILETWEKKFRDELRQFANSKLPLKSNQKIHSTSTNSMLEPIDSDLIVDYKNFLLSFILMTIITCISFPKFNSVNDRVTEFLVEKKNNNNKKKTVKEDEEDYEDEEIENSINKFKLLLLALVTSFIIGLTFLASLGLSTFLNLPFNLATIQILPPIALYYGFNQLNTIVNIYYKNYSEILSSSSSSKLNNLTTNCLNELFPIIIIESISYSIALLVSTIIPVPATRTLALQAITFIFTATFVSIVLIPAILTNFLLRYHSHHLSNENISKEINNSDPSNNDDDYNSEENDDYDCKIKNKNISTSCDKKLTTNIVTKNSKYGIRNKRAKETKCDNNNNKNGEIDHIFSRIQDDLKNIQKDSIDTTPADLNFSANINLDGLQTSFNLSTSTTNLQKNDIINNNNYTKTNDLVLLNPDFLPDILANTAPLPKTFSTPPVTQSSSKNIDLIKETVLDIDFCNDKNDDTKSKNSDNKLVEEEMKEEFINIDNYDDKINEIKLEKSNSSFCCQNLFDYYIETLTKNKYLQLFICISKLSFIILLLPYGQKVKYGIQLRDIVAQGTEQFDSISAQEKYFSNYNIFAITKGNFDYPSNQKLLHDYYKSISQVDGIIEDNKVSRFWLIAFRDWLLDIQNKFDIERNESKILSDRWTQDASESAKLGYKLLAQTGRIDNPIDRSLVKTNRLVDSSGIINQKAFYHYLTAWVSCDSYVYTTTEANFKPEPKLMSDNPDNLRIEKARPLLYAQIPFLMKLSTTNTNQDNIKMISEIRSISLAFERLNLPNFPTGIPFIFWDQFFNLDLLMLISITIGISSIFIVIFLMTLDINTAAILTIPIILTLLELYCIIGYLSIPFNNIHAVLLICSIGIIMIQTVPYVTFFTNKDGNLLTRTSDAIRNRFRIVITGLTLFLLCGLVFQYSKIIFIIKYSYLLLSLFLLNLFNSLLVTPIILSLFGSDYKPKVIKNKSVESSTKRTRSGQAIKSNDNKNRSNSNGKRKSSKSKRSKNSLSSSHKKQNYQRKIQSEISLSTISEEPQLESPCTPVQHDLRVDLSIKCY